MAILQSILLLIAAACVGLTNAQTLRPTSVTICYPAGNNTHATTTVPSTDLSKYPGHVKGKCDKHCQVLCLDFASHQFNATTGQCTCIGAPVKCGPNAKLSSDRKKCKCIVGYKGDPVKGCTDFNECTAPTSSSACPAGQLCINTIGSFTCKRCGPNTQVVNNQCQCKDGFEGDATVGCTDIDECLNEDTAYCGEDRVCQNLVGSSHCIDRCALYNPCGVSGKECIDIEHGIECVDPCGRNAERVNGTSTCQCKSGFVGDAKVQCVLPCGTNAQLVNGVCQCNAGFKGDAKVFCDSKDTCEARNNTNWAADKCRCDVGYQGDANVGCVDINECYIVEKSEFCRNFGWNKAHDWYGYECQNLDGGYNCAACGVYTRRENGRCVCKDGYKADANGICRCIPGKISGCGDECGQYPNTHYNWRIGSCACDDGYAGDPTKAPCVDVDECALGTHMCELAMMSVTPVRAWLPYQCVNMPGEYKCAPCGANTVLVNLQGRFQGRSKCRMLLGGDMVSC